MSTETRPLPQQEHCRPRAECRAHVLICDDEARLAQLTAHLLSSHGFHTHAATDLATARRQLTEVSVQAIVLDVNFPGESSFELLDHLEATGHDARVLLTSGLAEDDIPEVLLRHPVVVGYIGKPYSIDAVADLLHELLL